MRKTRLHRFVEDLLPWFDAQAEIERNQATEELRQRSIAARINAERISLDYQEAAEAATRTRKRP